MAYVSCKLQAHFISAGGPSEGGLVHCTRSAGFLGAGSLTVHNFVNSQLLNYQYSTTGAQVHSGATLLHPLHHADFPEMSNEKRPRELVSPHIC